MPDPTPRRGSRVLIVCADPLVAALLGIFVELVHHRPLFPEPGERPEDAIERFRPLAIVLVDGDLAVVASDLFLAAAARAKVGLAILGLPPSAARVRDLAEARGVPYFDFPASVAELERVLRDPDATRWWIRRRGQRRAPAAPREEPAAADAGVFRDASGQRWHVYDRRGADRRVGQGTEHVERVFVSDSGEVRASLLEPGEDQQRSPRALADQLARARPVTG